MPVARRGPTQGAPGASLRTSKPQAPTLPVDRRYEIAAAVVVLVGLAVVYAPVHDFGLVTMDDPAYVTDNPMVRRGLTWAGVRWAFTSIHAAHYIPLTWISLMADVSVSGTTGGMHVTNVVLHGLSAVGIGWLLARASGDVWCSWWVAAIFALHPCQVESVAWITERKDVLSTALALPALAAYGLYGQRRRHVWLWLGVSLYAASLLAKPLWVPLPLALLVLDYWPLQRWGSVAQRTLLMEKVPFVVLSAAAALSTMYAQATGGATPDLSQWPLLYRVVLPPWSLTVYLATLLLPIRLSPFYPLPAAPDVLLGLLGTTVLAALSAGLYAWRRVVPAAWAGWLWFVLMLLPVLGLVQSGEQARADRFTYVPMLGLAVLVGWLARSAARTQRSSVAMAAAAGLLLVVAALGSRFQVAHWRNGITLFEYALSVAPENWKAAFILGDAYREQGRWNDAERAYLHGLMLKPGDAIASYNLGSVRVRVGRHADALTPLQTAAAGRPEIAEFHNAVGAVLVELQRYDAALGPLQQALQIDPRLVNAYYNLGDALVGSGRLEEGIARFRQALQLRPDVAELRVRIADTLARLGRSSEALDELRAAVVAAPDVALVHQALGNHLADLGRLEEAETSLTTAVRLAPTLAAAGDRLRAVRSQLGR